VTATNEAGPDLDHEPGFYELDVDLGGEPGRIELSAASR
jgi:hypothetical protein